MIPNCAKQLLSRFIASAFFILFIASLCAAQESKNENSSSADPKRTIENILTKQTKAWNEGNLEKFMETYWKSDKLTFSGGGKTTYGWQGTLDNYKKSYAPPKQMGKLHFDGLEISMIESKSALVLGNWHLKMKDDQRKDGNFSLVVKNLDGNWKIIHDHSSTLEPEEKSEASDQQNAEKK